MAIEMGREEKQDEDTDPYKYKVLEVKKLRPTKEPPEDFSRRV